MSTDMSGGLHRTVNDVYAGTEGYIEGMSERVHRTVTDVCRGCRGGAHRTPVWLTLQDLVL